MPLWKNYGPLKALGYLDEERSKGFAVPYYQIRSTNLISRFVVSFLSQIIHIVQGLLQFVADYLPVFNSL